VLTGSHNWTSSADAENDENTVVVHNDTIANEYLQGFAGDFKAISGKSLTSTPSPCSTVGMNNISGEESELNIYPNPYKGSVNISYNLVQDANVTISVYNIMGEKVATLADGKMMQSGKYVFTFNGTSSGIYILQVNEGNHIYTRKLVQAQ
jgi:hypothetical protein